MMYCPSQVARGLSTLTTAPVNRAGSLYGSSALLSFKSGHCGMDWRTSFSVVSSSLPEGFRCSFATVAVAARSVARRMSVFFMRVRKRPCTPRSFRTGGLFLHVSRNLLDRGKNAHEVLAHDLADVGFRVAAALQLRADLRHVTDVLHAYRRRGDAVEVGSEAYVIDPGHFGDVVDVINDTRPGTFREGIGVYPVLLCGVVLGGIAAVLHLERLGLQLEALVAIRGCARDFGR